MTQIINSLPVIWKTQFQSQSQKDLLEEGRTTHSNILAWRIPWTEDPGGLCPWGHKEADTTE